MKDDGTFFKGVLNSIGWGNPGVFTSQQAPPLNPYSSALGQSALRQQMQAITQQYGPLGVTRTVSSVRGRRNGQVRSSGGGGQP